MDEMNESGALLYQGRNWFGIVRILNNKKMVNNFLNIYD